MAVRGRAGRGAAVVRGPLGGGAAVARGPGGRRAMVSRLPAGAARLHVGGVGYYRSSYLWYRPYYYGSSFVYASVYPPIGYYYDDLPDDNEVVAIDGVSYYYADGVYYRLADDGDGYIVAAEPTGAIAEPTIMSDPDAPDPFDTLRTMTDYIDGLDQFTFTAIAEMDDVLDNGDVVQMSTRRTVSVDRGGNRIAVITNGDEQDRRGLYDGKTFTVLDRIGNRYVALDMPATIPEMLDTLARDYGFSPPLVDLVYPDSYDGMVRRVETGQYLGIHRVEGYQSHHLAFTSAAVDWEIWIQTGNKPFPRKVVITYKNQPGSPRYIASLPRWSDTTGPLAFKLDIPADAEKVEILPVTDEDGPVSTAE